MKKERAYSRLTYTDHLIIEKLYNSGCSYRAIAKRLGRSVSSIHYEIKRGLYDHLDGATWKTVERYSATIADDDAIYQASAKGQIIKLGKRYDYAQEIAARILSGESPDGICGDLKTQGKGTVSTTTLYRYIDSGFIPGVTNKNLLVKAARKRKYHHVKKAARPPKGQSIESRPTTISARTTPGHWEMDTVIGKAKGKGQALLVLTERLTRYEIILKLAAKTINAVERALSKTVTQYPSGTFQTITVDNGSEFQGYAALKRLMGEVYYCHPYSSYERGSNENANRIIRRFFPKGQEHGAPHTSGL